MGGAGVKSRKGRVSDPREFWWTVPTGFFVRDRRSNSAVAYKSKSSRLLYPSDGEISVPNAGVGML